MLRENPEFLKYIEQLYAEQAADGPIRKLRFSPKDFLMRQAAVVREALVIAQGVCKISIEEENGRAYILEFLGKGEILGELELLRDTGCLCNVQALEEVSVYSLPKTFFFKLLESDFRLNRLLIDSFAERISNTSKKASFQKLYTLEDTLREFKRLQTEQQLEVSKSDLAEYLGISVRSLNRSLKSLEKEENGF